MDTRKLEQSYRLPIDYTKIRSYEEIKSQIQPLDLIGFRGGDAISDLISVLEEHKCDIGVFSHVGLVITSDILTSCDDFELVPGKLYLLESTFSYKLGSWMDNSPDVTTDKGRLGVQLRDLEDVIPRYITSQKTKVAWCKLLNNPAGQRSSESSRDYHKRMKKFRIQFEPLFSKYFHRPYEVSMISLFGAMFPSLRLLREVRDTCYKKMYTALSWFGVDTSGCPAGWQFCSELIGNIYQGVGLIDESFDARDILPIDFLGYDKDGLPALVEAPIFIRDWDIQDHLAITYE